MRTALVAFALVAAASAASLASMIDTKTEVKHRLALAIENKRSNFRSNIQDGLFESITANTIYGDVIGLTDGKVNQWLGVPFASPPVGDLRWKSPVPPANWGTLNTTWWQPACVQSDKTWTFGVGDSEDCLYLNIYAPATAAPSGGYPVMMFMYGGSWTFGSGSFPLYDGDFDVALLENTIIVTINYRLNVFGFLAGDLLKAESADGSVGNYGLQDQRAALQFIIDNIANFGGNPNLVTIFGESAGGGSTSNHLISPKSQGMFQRAIIESGAFSDWTAQPYNTSSTRLPQLASNLGCDTQPDVLKCLRAMNTSQIFDNQHGFVQAFLEWSPVIDGVEIPDYPVTLLKEGKVAQVPILLGFNHDEGTLFNDAPTTMNASDVVPEIAKILGEPLAEVVAGYYPVQDYASPWWTVTNILSDSQMICPGVQTGRYLTSASRQGGPQPTFVYYYTHIFEVIQIVDLFKPLGCFHGSELVNVFDISLLMWGPGEPELGKQFVRYWTRFAATGNPNGDSDPTWNPFDPINQWVAQLDTSAAGVNVTNLNSVKPTLCQFWNNFTIPSAYIYGA